MRIAQVIPFAVHPYSGVLAAVVRFAAELARRGHEVEVWGLHDWRSDDTRDQVEALEAAGAELVRIPTAGRSWWLGSAAKAAISGRQVDIVHLHNVFSPLNNLIARSLTVPYVLSPHGGYAPAVLKRHRVRKAVFKRLFEMPMLKKAALVCALTDAEEQEVRRFGFHGPVAVISSGVEKAPEVDRTAFRHELGLDESSLLAVFVGRLDVYYKRLDDLIRAVADAPSWNLALIGPEWKSSGAYLRALITDLGLVGRVRVFEPRRGRPLQQALAAADVFVLVSRSEGLPLALLEALALGTPALVSPEVERCVPVGGRGAGWVVEPGSLAARLESLAVTEFEDWTRTRQTAHHLAASFEWANVAARYEKAVERVV